MTFIADAAKKKTGTYTGDGALSMAVTGIGFPPVYVKIWPQLTLGGDPMAIHETTDLMVLDNAAGIAALHTTTAAHHSSKANAIISLDADGFTVDDNGADEHPNKNLQVYNYLAVG